MDLRRQVSGVCLFIIAFFLLSGSTHAQSTKKAETESPAEQNLIEILIHEIRQLRLAMERNGTTAFRAQIIVERLRAQQDLVSRINRDLDSLRNQLGEMKGEFVYFTEMLDQTEKKFASGLVKEDELKRMKAQAEIFKQREQSMRERENLLLGQLQTETARLDDLNKRIDLLEQTLDSTQNPDTPKRGKKN
jgi:predicted  nucleic acid-binding Zn-ribbon protein